ncbi:gamma-glutamyl-gamma-aminobutyrate hydrolase family protein [Meridianimarinicoccus aquatilis]|uniref:Gamma-glutamyl-gamma-aminobutyrate hydrolase family protein n=1 Tax=Meridianimarinicoccus aquatilis TaxID=2552766 RepID=A0A4V3BBT5_9RHOB|nr:type 1 glutamine amidotransferase [Fluviibacterium aquatile]QIE43613.1 type 1 glutamine amidotransferase [Rhodobacteraceae bacterium SC52]TDL88179.1 gamma-glutamyl-gamma-aminobutyrate hydrolase family protein [Fluviibacterium aquatile]
MSKRRPRIAVTTSKASSWRIFPMFALNIWLAGGRAVRWTAARPYHLDDVDGLVIGGGDDISPDIYGGELVSSARLDPARDAMEQELVTGACQRGMPVLGVCRGAQMINVALGGTLHQDAYGVYATSVKYKTILPRKTVSVQPGTQFAQIAGLELMRVNALHSQAVDRLGAGLRVAAQDGGGMVQAVEREDGPFMIGVQWHPEHLIYARRQRALFGALVAAA